MKNGYVTMAFLLFISLCGAGASFAQTNVTSAQDYFNLGSATFIRDNPESALAIVNEGLMFHPDDEPLLRLKALLEQKNEQNQQNQPNQDTQDPSSDRDNSESPSPPDEQSEPPPDQNEAEPPASPGDQESPQPPPEQAPADAEEMTEDEAEMVLDSLRQLEQAQREEIMKEMIRRQMQQMPPVEKDW